MSEIDPFTTPSEGTPGGTPAPALSAAEGASPALGQPAPPPPPVAPPPPRRSRAGLFFIGAFSGCAVVFLFLVAISIAVAAARNDSTSADWRLAAAKVAIIPIEGEIVEARETIDRIHRYADSATVRAIVMRIDSPGGAIAPTQEIYEEIRK